MQWKPFLILVLNDPINVIEIPSRKFAASNLKSKCYKSIPMIDLSNAVITKCWEARVIVSIITVTSRDVEPSVVDGVVDIKTVVAEDSFATVVTEVDIAEGVTEMLDFPPRDVV